MIERSVEKAGTPRILLTVGVPRRFPLEKGSQLWRSLV
eukprot:COSAG06_NODE_27824_length_585_cov_4.594650_2_plen_37_part_01